MATRENWENRFKWEDTVKKKKLSLSALMVFPTRKELESLIPRLPSNKELLEYVHNDEHRKSKSGDIYQVWSCTFDIETHQKTNKSKAPTYMVSVENGCLVISLCYGYRKYIEHCWHIPRKIRDTFGLVTNREAVDGFEKDHGMSFYQYYCK